MPARADKGVDASRSGRLLLERCTLSPCALTRARPTHRRGWLLFERRLGALTKQAGCFLELDRIRAGLKHWAEIRQETEAKPSAPTAPDVFECQLRAGLAREAAEPGAGVLLARAADEAEVLVPQHLCTLTLSGGHAHPTHTQVLVPQYREEFLRRMGEV